jgi:hypothetical protein
MLGFARLPFWEIASAALGDCWVPWEVGFAGALLGTGWLVVTMGGIHLGVRHHELRAETPRENPARWWPPRRHG